MSEADDPPPPVVAPAPGPLSMQSMSERIAKLDVIKVIIGLLVAVALPGFIVLAMQISRMDGRISALESKLDTLSVKVAETPGVFQRELQASTDKLTALINATRQTGSSTPPVPPRTEVPGLPSPSPQVVEPPRQAGAPSSVKNSIPIPPVPQGPGRIIRR